jgi:hypothetical protein
MLRPSRLPDVQWLFCRRKISKQMVNGYFAGTDYCRITIIITIIKTKQKSFEKFEMIIIIVK